MTRIVGILCGSALAIAFLIIALGLPEFHPAPEPLPEIVAAIADEPADAPAPIPIPIPIVEEIPVIPPVQQATAENWFAFWSPFRSEIAADGFISQLQRQTGIDYRVVKVKPGVYEVAFAYNGDTDIEAKLATITRATGLEMPDG